MIQKYQEIKRAVSEVFSKLQEDDGCLFDCEIEEEGEYVPRKLHEVCINHRLAIYLEKKVLPIISDPVQKYFVDIEFNREGTNKKKLNDEERVVRPDIIIHNRKFGDQKKNFLVVECKKNDSSFEEITKDKEKIQAFLEDPKYSYSFGLQVVYGKNKIEGTLFYKNWQGIEQETIIVP